VSEGGPPQASQPQSPGRATAWAWWLLLGLYLVFAVTFSLVQPLGGPLDETAHLRYVKFLAQEHRLPVWNNVDGGEAGFEDQHPPLFYGVMAGCYALVSPLEERWRWYVLRWVQVLVGLVALGVAWRFFREALPPGSRLVGYATASVALLPAFLFYASHVNPDLWVMLWTTWALLLALRLYLRPGDLRLALWLGLACGLGTLTKLSAAPALVLALLVEVWSARQGGAAAWRTSARTVAVTLGVWLVLCGWWFVRNELVSGVLVPISTLQNIGTGLGQAAILGFRHMIALTAVATYLSTPIPMEWPPSGAWAFGAYLAVTAVAAVAVIGLLRGGRRPELAPEQEQADRRLRVAVNLSGLMIALVLAAQQWSYWTQDVAKNMGGRYMLAVVPALALVLVFGLSRRGRFGRGLLPAYLGVLLAINVASAWNIVNVLTPLYQPGWHMFQEAPPTEPPVK
jgi:hypothetical protein